MAEKVSTDSHEPRDGDVPPGKKTVTESVQSDSAVDRASPKVDDVGEHVRGPGATVPFSKKLCFKLDLWLLTPMFFLNFLSLMGRTNVGAALIQELPADLHLSAIKTFTVTVMPLIMLILFEVPSNLLMRWLERNWGLSYMRYLSLITVGLGMSPISGFCLALSLFLLLPQLYHLKGKDDEGQTQDQRLQYLHFEG